MQFTGVRRRGLAVLAVATTVVSLSAAVSAPADAATTLTIGIDLPMQGFAATTSADTVRMIGLYLDRVHHKAGSHTVATKVYDDSTAAKGAWDDATCVSNAKKHVANHTEVAVFGTYNSGCAALELPILNQASGGPLLMVSHANTNPGLTKKWDAGTPSKYYPTGKRNYARVLPTDDLQGSAAANVAGARLKAKRVYVLDDGQVYGIGIARAFIARAKKAGVTVVGHKSWKGSASNYLTLFRAIKATRPTAIYLGGIYDNNGARLFKDKVAVLGSNAHLPVLAPDGFTGYPDLDEDPNAQGAYLTFTGAYTAYLAKHSTLTKGLLAAFRAKYHRSPAGSYPFYGVAALQVILKAIANSNGTRASVTNAVFHGRSAISFTKAASATGQAFSISRSTGDTTSRLVTLETVKSRRETAVAVVDG